MRVVSFTVRKTTDEEKERSMPYFTSSMMEAVNTCPKWGIINNVNGKAFTIGYRQMALEAGSLMHEVFSCFNLYQVGAIQHCIAHMKVHGRELFGKDRFAMIFEEQMIEDLVNQDFNYTIEQHLMFLERLAYNTIATSDFYDDPDDRNRTISNIEHCALELANYWLMNFKDFNIYIEAKDNPFAPIGVEMSFDVVYDVECIDSDGVIVHKLVRFIGLGDVVYQNHDTGKVTLGEYKTASRMGDAWRDNFQTRHQLTAYNGCLLAYFPEETVTMNTILIGSAIPVRKTTTPVQHFMIDRDKENVCNFLTTLLATQDITTLYQGDKALQAPMFTHSCSRYFVTCALLDLCASSYNDQVVMYNQMLDKPELSPSEMKALLKGG